VDAQNATVNVTQGSADVTVIRTGAGLYTVYVRGLRAITSWSCASSAWYGVNATLAQQPDKVNVTTFNTTWAAADGNFVLTVTGWPQ
jgi:hypothetical protein